MLFSIRLVRREIQEAFLLSLWLFIFTLVIKPFQIDPLTVSRWIVLAIGYSSLAFLGYVLTCSLAKKYLLSIEKRTTRYEVIFLLFYFLILLIPCFLFHRSTFSKGIYNFIEFSSIIYLPSTLILTPILLFLRTKTRGADHFEKKEITIKGENKKDILQILPDQLVCISNAQNYVDIYYLEDKKLTKKVIRTTLTKLEKEYSFLIRVHRSHLINPRNFVEWKDLDTLQLKQITIPVSRTYRKSLLTFLNHT